MVDKRIKKSKRSSRVWEGDKRSKNSSVVRTRVISKPKKVSNPVDIFPLYKKSFLKRKKSLNFNDFFKGCSSQGFIKRDNFIISRKVFTKKINLNKIRGCQPSTPQAEVLNTSNILRLKASIYILLKSLKNLKKIKLSLSLEESFLNELDQFCLKLEKSGFYTSLIEREKKFSYNCLKVKTEKRLCDVFTHPFRAEKLLGKSFQVTNHLIPIKNSYQSFQRKSRKAYNTLAKVKVPGVTIKKGFVHLKKNYSYIMESRISLYMATYKKKYTKLFRVLKSNKLKFRRLFFDFQIKQLRHTFRMKKRYKLYRSLAWKRKKKKNRKKVGLFYFLQRRPRMLFRFYVPRHLEINYKTFSLAHLGELDLPSVNSRIGFWLNLRRLLTSLAI